MPTLDDRIADMERHDQTYWDPQLWLRLEPILLDGIQRARDALCGPPAPDYAAYRERLGYLRGLEFVLHEAVHLIRKESD